MSARPISISHNPNLETDDLRLAARLLARPGQWERGDGVRELAENIKKFFGVKHVFPLVSGRACLWRILQALNMREGDEVLVQAFTCVAVPDAALWAGGKPIYVDIEERTLSMNPADVKKKINPRSRAVVIQHTFGIPAPVEEIARIARERDAIVIEDCAHVIGGEYKGRKLGTIGDVGFLSFGRDKAISSVFGGAIITNHDALAAKIEAQSATAAPAPKRWILQQLLYPFLMAGALRVYNVFGLGKILLEIYKVLRIISRSTYPVEKQGGRPRCISYRMPNALARLALHQFQKISRLNAHRRTLAGVYQAHFPNQNTRNAILLRYPILVEHPEKLLRHLRRANIVVGDWYRVPVAPPDADAEKVFYVKESCPAAERVARRVINLPTNVTVSESQATRIAAEVQKFRNEKEL